MDSMRVRSRASLSARASRVPDGPPVLRLGPDEGLEGLVLALVQLVELLPHHLPVIGVDEVLEPHAARELVGPVPVDLGEPGVHVPELPLLGEVDPEGRVLGDVPELGL
jgi:hypothetical protein